jgi:hypothetical protein
MEERLATNRTRDEESKWNLCEREWMDVERYLAMKDILIREYAFGGSL